MPKPIRTRFAPSPTGFLHIGALRTALFKYLFARHTGGAFILRIDDTDQQRLVEGAEQQIITSLRSLGLDWDEGPEVGGNYGPYKQSERFDIYRKYADQLAKKSVLYPCWCTPERLDALRHEAQKEHRAFKYDRHCLLPKNLKSLEDPHVLRFRVPDEDSTITWPDVVKGDISILSSEVDDFVAIKSDGWPTYHFSSIVDDFTMKISHVVRGDEWVASTPKHILLYRAFGWEPPTYAHVPPILGPDGKKKLSKRDGVKSVDEYLKEGYLEEVLINFLALLGWNPGDGSTKEIYSRDELIMDFSLERIQKSPAKFDSVRLEWMNGVYVRHLPIDELLVRVEDFWPAEGKNADRKYKKQVLALVQERLKYLAELPELTEFFFAEPNFDPSLIKLDVARARDLLTQAVGNLENSDFSHEDLENKLRAIAETTEVKTGQLFGLIRICITGKTAAPGLFETLQVLGKEASISRLKKAARGL